jgi:endonuclease I
MNYIITFILFLSSFSYIFSTNICNIEVQDTLNFGKVKLRANITENIKITNNGNSIAKIYKITFNSHFQNYIEIENSNFPISINPSSDINLIVKLNARQNINLSGILFIQVSCDDYLYSIPVYVKSEITVAEINNAAAVTDNKFGPDLISAMSGYLQNHTSFSYRDARKLFWGSFDKHNGVVECIYTGKTIDPGADPDFTALDSKGFNTEHTWPKSLGAENPPPESDINHLFVSDKTTNDKRANYPFGFVTSGITYENGGSKLGKNSAGKIAFEPRDKYKGNIARGLFYFALRYNNPNKFLDEQESDLRQWLSIDPIDQNELSRNDSVIKYQKKSNLFIEFPELLDRIPSISQKTYPEYVPNYFVSDTGVVFDLSKFDATSKIRIWVTNFSNRSGSDALPFVISNINTKGFDDIFDVEFDTKNLSIPLDNTWYMDISCKNLNKNASGELFINYSNSHSEIVKIHAVNGTVGVDESLVSNNYKVSNYPNPANGFTSIELSGIQNPQEILSAKVYDLVHGEVADLTGKIRFSDSKASVDFSTSSLVKSGQIYFVRFELKNKSIIHPVLFLN